MEDQDLVRQELKDLLEAAGYDCIATENFMNVSTQIEKSNPDLVLLDINLPFESGFQICMNLKKESSIPVLVLTSRDTVEDETLSLDIGADDFIAKPFRREILLARIRALLRRSLKKTKIFDCGWFKLEPEIFTIYINGKSQMIPANEGRILSLLAENQGKSVSKKEICLALWESDEFIDANTLSVNITRLRQHLAAMDIPEVIKTVRGFGYMLEEYKNE